MTYYKRDSDMTIDNKNPDQRLRKLLNTALIPAGFRPKGDADIDAMLDTIGGEPLSSEKLARMLQKVQGKEPLGKQQEEEINVTSKVLSETHEELLMLYRARGRNIPPEIQAILNEMRKRAAELSDEQKNES